MGCTPVGFDHDDEFVVRCGLDYNGLYRVLPYAVVSNGSVRPGTGVMIQARPKRPTYATFSAATSQAPSRPVEVASTWTTLPGGVVDTGEIVILAIKPSMWRPLFESAPWMVVCGLLAVALTSLSRPLAGLSMVSTVQVILLVGFARLGLAVVRWIPSWYVLTNRRVISIQGVRAPRITACPLIQIRNTHLTSTPAEQLARLGTIAIVTESANDPARSWQSVARADLVHAAIRRAIKNAIDYHGHGGC